MATVKKKKNLKTGTGFKKNVTTNTTKKSPKTFETTDDVAEGSREEVEKSLLHQR